jgi:hypothetical protein
MTSSQDGTQRAFVTETKLDASGKPTSEWTKTYLDMLGREYKTLDRVTDGQTNVHSQRWFNSKGQLWKERDPDNVVTLYSYNTKGELHYTALDLNRDDDRDFAGMDRVTRQLRSVASKSGVNIHRVQTYVWGVDNSNTSNSGGWINRA